MKLKVGFSDKGCKTCCSPLELIEQNLYKSGGKSSVQEEVVKLKTVEKAVPTFEEAVITPPIGAEAVVTCTSSLAFEPDKLTLLEFVTTTVTPQLL